MKLGGFLSTLRSSIHHSSDGYLSGVVIKAEIGFIIGGQARLKTEGTREEGDYAQAGQDYRLPVGSDEKEEGEGNKPDKEQN